MKIHTFLKLCCIATLLILNTGSARAQGGGFDPANFDPAKIQQRMMDGYRKAMDITDDSEWKVIEPLIQKVTEARRQSASLGMGAAGIGGMFGGGGGGGGRGGQFAAAMSAFLPPPYPAQEALKR